MKKLIITAIIVFISSVSFSQIDSSKVEQYCEVIATPRLLSNKVTIDINYGEQKSIWKDTRLKDDEGKLKKFNTVVDALNYMGKDGWIFVNAFPVLNGTTQIYHYVFKKWFAKNEAGE
ncbi:hypothetical protein FW778_15115 [Ginsengibacter hankyongi]|uniref:DUF4177 domain-containing protein n=1 Tax=Ginsengibacter hankyongi TaxID=2607284 RepID=A0A5J5IFM5_9BACT|nr:hypothetical protein [Ginsengibacter hankyongi]KAA9038085.1 hypothetical protein FW778_15115 [Ginsengibacter hankyongi]